MDESVESKSTIDPKWIQGIAGYAAKVLASAPDLCGYIRVKRSPIRGPARSGPNCTSMHNLFLHGLRGYTERNSETSYGGGLCNTAR